nr:MAG TPA: hypothetical protein [Caudoviricetes sp.]
MCRSFIETYLTPDTKISKNEVGYLVCRKMFLTFFVLTPDPFWEFHS